MKNIERLFLRPSEAAEAIGCSTSEVYKLIKAGKLKAASVGGLTRIPVQALRQIAEDAMQADAR
jgi:excisionase family DNA binding protein